MAQRKIDEICEIECLNLDDLDVEELERRLEMTVTRTSRSAPPTPGAAAAAAPTARPTSASARAAPRALPTATVCAGATAPAALTSGEQLISALATSAELDPGSVARHVAEGQSNHAGLPRQRASAASGRVRHRAVAGGMASGARAPRWPQLQLLCAAAAADRGLSGAPVRRRSPADGVQPVAGGIILLHDDLVDREETPRVVTSLRIMALQAEAYRTMHAISRRRRGSGIACAQISRPTPPAAGGAAVRDRRARAGRIQRGAGVADRRGRDRLSRSIVAAMAELAGNEAPLVPLCQVLDTTHQAMQL